MYLSRLSQKFNESIAAVVPIVAIVVILSLTLAPMPNSIILAFLFGGIMVVFGMMFFNLGAELAMEPMGSLMGSTITATRKLILILSVGFFLGLLITVSEPDLQVLASQVLSIPSNVLIYGVGLGVGIFLVIALLRSFLNIPLTRVLMVAYAIVFILLIFAPKSFLAVAFDSGGVTTGPMTVPFIMAFGVGVAALRSDTNSAESSFGLVALCSVGPIMAVLILSIIYAPEDALYAPTVVPDITNTIELNSLFTAALPQYFEEIAVSMMPIAAFFGAFQILTRKADKNVLIKIIIGVVYTYIGLVLFLTGANVGFMPAGSYLGTVLASESNPWIIIPVGMLIGYFIVQAEPAVFVLTKQVEELSNGAIKPIALRFAFSLGVAASVGLALLRVITGLSILWLVVPGYALAFALTAFTPSMYTAIAFDSGGVASGPMTATFLLPFAMGACLAVGGNVVTDAFGVVAMVALTPLLSIQILGMLSAKKKKAAVSSPVDWGSLASLEDNAIIEL